MRIILLKLFCKLFRIKVSQISYITGEGTVIRLQIPKLESKYEDASKELKEVSVWADLKEHR